MNTKGYSRVVEPLQKGFIDTDGYLVVIEPVKNGFSAFCPDLPGCITVGKTVELTKQNMQEAIELYLEELTETGAKIPDPKKLKDLITGLEHSGTDAYIAFVPIIPISVHAKSA